MNSHLIVTSEILLTVVLPLLIVYLKSDTPLGTKIGCLLVIPPLWYLTYSPLHELSHVLGTYLVGGTVTYIKLIPRFWVGEFGRAWITPEGLRHDWQWLTMTSLPYVLDMICIVVGGRVLRRRMPGNPFIAGLVFMLLLLRPLFDLVCETVAFASGQRGDFYHMQLRLGGGAMWLLIAMAIAASLHATMSVVGRRPGRAARRRGQAPLEPAPPLA